MVGLLCPKIIPWNSSLNILIYDFRVPLIMPNRWERINGVLVPKNISGTRTVDSVQTFPDYSYKDDFGYTTDAQTNLVYTAQTGDTLSYVATGAQDATGTTAGNGAGFITSGAGNFVDATKKLTYKARVQLSLDDEELFAYIGCAETTPTVADPPVEADDFIGFTLVETTADANWSAVCATDLGTDETIVDTGIVVDLLPHNFEFVLQSGRAEFKIDGNVVAIIVDDIPVATDLVPQIKVITGDTDAKGIIADVLAITNAR